MNTTLITSLKNLNLKATYLCICCILLVQFSAKQLCAQNSAKTDSLIQVIKECTNSDEKGGLQLDLAETYFEKDNAQARDIILEVLKYSRKANNELLELRALFLLGKIEHVFNSVEVSQLYFDTAISIAQKLNNKFYEAEILLRLGINHHARSEHIKALEKLTQAVQTGREGNNYRIVGASYSMMGSIFRINGLYDRAIEYIIKAKYNYNKEGFLEGEAWSAYLLGRIYRDLQLNDKAAQNLNDALHTYQSMADVDRNQSGVAICKEQLGLLHLENNELGKARINIMYTLNAYSESKSQFGISNAYKNLGYIEYASGNYQLAYEYLSQSLQDKNDIGERLSLPGIYHHLGLCEIKLKEEQKGLSSIQKGLEIATQNNQKRIELDIYKTLADHYMTKNALSDALFYLNKQIAVQDTMLLGAANIKYEQLQSIYEVDEKNHQISELQKQNEINDLKIKQHRNTRLFLAIAIVLALLIASIIAIFYRRIQQKNKLLAEANATKDRFFAIIAHDLRGPCLTLTTFLEQVLNEYDDIDKEELKEMLVASHQSSEKVSKLLDTLLTWANSQRNKIDIKPEHLVFDRALTQALEGLKHSAEKKQISINTPGNTGLSVFADANMLQTILRNLLNNAIKFTPRNGAIQVSYKAIKSNHLVIRIADNGVGIPSHLIQNLFKLSNQYHTRGTENESSSGLGLILVKEFVDKNNGQISITSKVNKGTIVNIKLPLGKSTE